MEYLNLKIKSNGELIEVKEFNEELTGAPGALLPVAAERLRHRPEGSEESNGELIEIKESNEELIALRATSEKRLEVKESKFDVNEFDTLVSSGASIRGFIELGALQYLIDKFIIKEKELQIFIGTSSGAIINYLLSIGYTPKEIIVYVCTHQIMEKIPSFNVVAMIGGGGAISFTFLYEQLEKMTIHKIGKCITLGELYKEYGKKLICVTHNETLNKTEYLGPDNCPNLPCLLAIKMSCNLPFIFEKFKYMGNFYVDGGLSDNFAIQKGEELGKKVLGIFLTMGGSNFSDNPDILEYIYKLMFIPITQAIEYKINQASEKCTIIRIKSVNIKMFGFNIDSKTKLEMFSYGYQDTKKIFEVE